MKCAVRDCERERLTSNAYCRECRNRIAREYRKTAKNQAYRRAYKKRNAIAALKYQRQYRARRKAKANG